MYLLKCATLLFGVAYELPAVFHSNPYKYTINGSLWTMPHELWMYVILAFVWMFLSVMPQFRSRAFKITIVTAALLAGAFVVINYVGIARISGRFLKLFFMLFSGAFFYILKNRIVMSQAVFYASLIALLLSTVNKHIFFLVYLSTLAYILFFLAYIPSGFIRTFNKLGDYS